MPRVPTELLVAGVAAVAAFFGVGVLTGARARARGQSEDQAARTGTNLGIAAALIAGMLGALVWRAATGTL